jgi:acylphosphatase
MSRYDSEGSEAYLHQAQRIVRVTITGRVQGVGYRAFTQTHAEARGVNGWVRNRSNGDVEAVFAGSVEAVEALCALCSRGPAFARVDRVEVRETDAAVLTELGVGAGFRQIATI